MFKQVELSYGFDALEPHIDTLTMDTHYSKHHAAYTKNFNTLADSAGISNETVEDILAAWKRKLSNEENGQAIRNNAGGYYNHNMYFSHLSPNGGGEPSGELADKIKETFGTFTVLKEQIKNAAIGQFGSGWAWLNSDSAGVLSVSASLNQDNPILETEGKLFPILAVDVWEHAYYLKYKNLRADYLDELFNVIDWGAVAGNYKKVAG